MLTTVERVLALTHIDLLEGLGPRHLIGLARVAREIEIWKGQVLYEETSPADALYVLVEGRVRLSSGERVLSEIAPGEAFGSWALVDDSAREQKAECIEDGVALALDREDFYEVAGGDIAILRELLRVLARRLRVLTADRPEEQRVEGEGAEEREPAAALEAEPAVPAGESARRSGAEIEAAVLDKDAQPAREAGTRKRV